jgi:hypothetical protein
MDIASLKDAIMQKLASNSTGTVAPVNPATGEQGQGNTIDLSLISNLRSLLGMNQQTGQLPVNMAGPQGSVPRQAMEIEALKQQYMKAISEGRTQEAMQLEQAIKQMQNPQPI